MFLLGRHFCREEHLALHLQAQPLKAFLLGLSLSGPGETTALCKSPPRLGWGVTCRDCCEG